MTKTCEDLCSSLLFGLGELIIRINRNIGIRNLCNIFLLFCLFGKNYG